MSIKERDFLSLNPSKEEPSAYQPPVKTSAKKNGVSVVKTKHGKRESNSFLMPPKRGQTYYGF